MQGRTSGFFFAGGADHDGDSSLCNRKYSSDSLYSAFDPKDSEVDEDDKDFRRFGDKAGRKSHEEKESIENAEFIGLMLFVGIPLPGTGAWTGSLIAALLEIDFKKAILAELLGVAIATVIMSFLSYGLLGAIIG